MHVAMLTNNAAPYKLGGLERYVAELSQHLVRLGVDVTVIAKARDRSAAGDSTGPDGVRILRYPMPSKSDPLFAAKYPSAVARGVTRALRTAGPADVVHCHFAVPAMVPALRGQRYLYTFHAPVWREILVERQDSYLLPRPLQRFARAGLRGVERRVVARAQQVLTLSEFMREEVTHLDPRAGDRVQVVPGGIDTEQFVPLADAPGHPGPGPHLFTARRLVPRTGVGQLVEAMPKILEALPHAQLRVAGDGMQRESIDRLIEKLGLGASVTMLGRLDNGDLVRSYQLADLAVTPTQHLEGFGLSTAEALACGTPCLVTPIGANPEVVARLSERLITRDHSPGALADGVIDWFGSSARHAEAISADCRAVVDPAYSWASIADRHLDLYRSAGVA